MPDWGTIRRIARQKRAELLTGGGDATSLPPALVPASDLVDRALRACGLQEFALQPSDPLLAGADAVLDRQMGAVWRRADARPETARFNLAHELAHWWLHEADAPCHGDDLSPDALGDPLPFAEAYVSGYSPAQRREIEANAFAAEFLLPAPALRDAFMAGLGASEIAAKVGLSESTVLAQLAEAVVGAGAWDDGAEPQAHTAPPSSPTDGLDESQRAAAEVAGGPVLVSAGPGTGKTRTLVARMLVLLERGVAPERILALTFSNRAANEMRERLEQARPNAARRVWIGTFHAFGLELLRRYGTRLGLPPSPPLLDPVDAVTLLENNLARLELREYEYLHNPAFPMRDILGAISRAKDELIASDAYEAIARARLDAAETDDERTEAEKGLEVAGVYRVWQQILREQGKLDFGDLLSRAVELLDSYPDVLQEVREQYREILVDEYQDINRASALLVQRVAGAGHGLWAVGDLRQAIYRFRGASPANVENFEHDYPAGRRMSLDVNYRTRGQIVRLFAEAAGGEARWTARRGEGEAAVTVAAAEDEEAQADGLAREVRASRDAGIPYREQAILCRTNTQAEALSSALGRRGVPVLYLGNLLARPEVRDMLSLLALATESSAQGLLRAARFPAYDVPQDAVLSLLADAREKSRPIAALLRESAEPELARLRADLAELPFGGEPFTFLARYLFGHADYLRRLVREDSVLNRQARMALYQLLLLARGYTARLGAAEENQRAGFLAHVRHLLAINEETRIRQPVGAEAVDAVRLMTAHASKGLEFPVVFLPNMAKDLFPARRQGSLVRAAQELAGGGGNGEEDEEDRLFFVALSRARDHLVVSYPRRVAGRARAISRLLAGVTDALARVGARHVEWRRETPVESSEMPAPSGPEPGGEPVEYGVGEVEQYMRCPRQYYYARVLRLGREDERTAYSAYRRCLWSVIGWMRDERAAGRDVTREQASGRLAACWEDEGPAGHAYEPILRARAEAAVAHIVDLRAGARAEGGSEVTAALPEGTIRIPVSHVEETGEGMLVEEYRTNRAGASDHTDPRLALIRLAAEQTGARATDVTIRYVTTGERRPVPRQPRYEPDRVAKYRKALGGMRRREFAARPSQECTRCPFFLVCPAE